MPDEPEVHGLLALMLLHDARRERALPRRRARAARRPGSRRSGTAAQIDAGRAALDRALALRGRGPVRRCRPRSPRCTPTSRATGRRSPRSTASWPRLTGSPVVELNRAVAVAEAEGPEAGLRRIDGLELDGYHYLHSTRADLLRRLGRADEARAAYERALELAALRARAALPQRAASPSSEPARSIGSRLSRAYQP